jgi:hypothetical protein
MATCPHCKEFLGDGHVCSGRLGRWFSWFSSLALSVIIGAILGAVFFGLLGSILNIPGFELVGVLVGPIAAFVIMRSVKQW